MDSSQVICPHCGSDNTASGEYCGNCGLPLQGLPLSDKTISANDQLSQPYLSSGAVLQNRYAILDVIGQGGMGIVYKAEDLRLGKRIVAIKEMSFQGIRSKAAIDQASKALEQEALLLENLSHPSLPSIYDHFEDNGHWYLVMEYIQGETLTSRMKNELAEYYRVQVICRLWQTPRSSYYYQSQADEKLELHAALQRLAGAWPR